MAWDLRGNMDEEIERAILLKTFTPEQVAQLFPAYPADHPLIVPEMGQPAAVQFRAGNLPDVDWVSIQQRFSSLDGVLGPSGAGIGSNSWAISGTLTASGMPLLANDPHLSIQMPSIWYQVGLHCKPVTARVSLRGGGVLLCRGAGSHHRAQPEHCLGFHQHRSRRDGPVYREDQPG